MAKPPKYSLRFKVQRDGIELQLCVPCKSMKDVRDKMAMVKRVLDVWPYGFAVYDGATDQFIKALST